MPNSANVANNHSLYRVKAGNDGPLRIKGRTAPHGNENDIRAELLADCTLCFPVGIRALESVSSLKGWIILKANAKTTFLQTVQAKIDVYAKQQKTAHRKFIAKFSYVAAAHCCIRTSKR